MAQDIRTKLILDNRDFNRGIDDSEKKSKNFGASLSKMATVAAGAAKAVGLVATAISGLAVNQARLGGQLVDTASKIGVSTKFLQEFRFAAVQSGASIQAADMGLQRFTRRMAEAANGTGEARKVLRELGIQVRDSNGVVRDAESVLMDVADAFAEGTNQSEMLAQAFKLFDSEGAVLINVLRNGSEAMREFATQAEDAGIILSEMDARTLKSLDDSFTTVGFSIKALADQVAVGLAEAFEISNQSLIEFVAANKDAARAIGEGLGKAISGLIQVTKALITLLQNELVQSLLLLPVTTLAVSKTFAGLGVAMGGIVKLGAGLLTPLASLGKILAVFLRFATIPGLITVALTGLFAFRNETVKVGETVTTFGEIAQAIFMAAVNAVGTFVQSATSWFAQLRDRITNRLTELFENNREVFEKIGAVAKGAANFIIGIFVVAIKNVIDTFFLLPGVVKDVFMGIIEMASQTGKSLFNIIKAGLTGDFQGVKDEFANFGEQIGETFADRMANPVTNFVGEIKNNFQEALGTDFIGAAFTKAAEVVGIAKDRVEELVLELRRSKIAGEEAAAATEDFGKDTAGSVGVARKSLDELTTDFKGGWKDASREFLKTTQDFTKLGGEMFKKFSDGLTQSLTDFVMTGKLSFKSLLRDMFRMIVQSGIQRALAGIFSAMGSSGGVLGSLFSSFAGGNALGGMIPAGQFGLVGERGPEFIGGPAQITPIRQGDMAGGATQQVTYNINAVDASSFRDLVARDPEFIHAVASTGARRLPR